MTDRHSELISSLVTAITNCALYEKEHEAVFANCVKAITAMDGLFIPEGTLTLTVLGEALLINDARVTAKGIHIGSFIGRMRHKGIQQIVIQKDITPEELVAFVADISARGVPGAIKHKNIEIGILEVKFRPETSADPASVISGNIEQLREIHGNIAKFGTLDVMGLEEIVLGFISMLQSQTSVLKIVQPIRAYSDYTFAHSANVTIMSLFIAETLGVGDDMLQDVGIAALMHDIGKIFVPKAILDKESKLDAEEWAEMKKHTIYGAKYLASLPEVPKLAVMAAYEHHIRHDGTGYPDTKWRGRTQHTVSQIVAIADFFDALRTDRPYRKALGVPVIIGIMKEACGKEFSPLMVDHFIRSLSHLPGGLQQDSAVNS